MTLAAEAPDIDILWRFRGPVAALQHHRGITHTLIAAPVVALVVTGAIWLFDRALAPALALDAASAGPSARPGPRLTPELRPRLSPELSPDAHPDQHPDRHLPQHRGGLPRRLLARILKTMRGGITGQPVRWLPLWLFATLAALSHLLLDYTNNYGVRPFFPFNPRWYSWDIVFVVEPLMLVSLAAALILPLLFGLTDREMGVRGTRFRGRGWAIAALVSIVLLYALRNAEHAHALLLLRNSAITREPGVRFAAEAYTIDPFRWYGIVQTADYYQTAIVHTRTDEIDTDSGQIIYKPAETPATRAAKSSWLGHAYLDWAGIPVVTDRGNAGNLPPVAGIAPPSPNAGWTAVHFEDLRFAYPPVSFASFNSGEPPLSGWVYIGPSLEVEEMVMDNKEQR